jgi:hypothetical protein
VRLLTRILLVLCTLTWWVLPGMGLIDLTVTWDPEWPVMLEAGWGVLFTAGLGLPFLVAGVNPRLARVALTQLYVVTAALLVGVVAGLEPQSWWIFGMLAVELPLVHAVALPTSPARRRPRPALLVLAVGAALPALAYAWDMAALNRESLSTSDITNDVDHYAVQAALAVALIALTTVAALRSDTRRLLGTSTAAMAAYLGLVSYHWPGTPGGFGPVWSVAVMAWAAAVLTASWWPPGHRSSVPAGRARAGVRAGQGSPDPSP